MCSSPHLLLLICPTYFLIFFYVLDRQRSQRINCCWMVLSVIPALSVEMPPLPGSAGEKHIPTVCDYTVFSTFNLMCADFIFVGCETVLSGELRNAWRKDGYYAWRKQYLLSRSCLPQSFFWVASQKGPHVSPWKAKRCEKIGFRDNG